MPTIYLNMRTFTKLVDAGHFNDYESFISKAVDKLLAEEKTTGSNPVPPPPAVENTQRPETVPASNTMKEGPPPLEQANNQTSIYTESTGELCPICAQPVRTRTEGFVKVKGITYHARCAR